MPPTVRAEGRGCPHLSGELHVREGTGNHEATGDGAAGHPRPLGQVRGESEGCGIPDVDGHACAKQRAHRLRGIPGCGVQSAADVDFANSEGAGGSSRSGDRSIGSGEQFVGSGGCDHMGDADRCACESDRLGEPTREVGGGDEIHEHFLMWWG